MGSSLQVALALTDLILPLLGKCGHKTTSLLMPMISATWLIFEANVAHRRRQAPGGEAWLVEALLQKERLLQWFKSLGSMHLAHEAGNLVSVIRHIVQPPPALEQGAARLAEDEEVLQGGQRKERNSRVSLKAMPRCALAFQCQT